MNILHLTPYMECGGTERCIINLICRSLENGHRVFLVSPEGGGLKNIPQKVNVYKLRHWSVVKPFTSVYELKKLLLTVHKKVDIIQVHASAEMAYLAKKYLPELPVIFTCHGYDNYLPSYFNYWLASRFLKNVNCVVALNPLDKEYFIQAGVEKEKVVFIPNGVEERFFNQKTKGENNKKVVGIVGRLVRQKNIEWAIKAQARCRFSSRLLIAGDGPLRSKLERRAKKLGVDREVIFLGHKDEVEKVYPLFSYLLVCSRNEAFALIILEALASGVPVFVPSWLPGLVRLWQSAPGVFVFKNGKDLKEQIEKGKGAGEKDKLQSFAKSFLWDNIFKKYQELYFKLLTRESS